MLQELRADLVTLTDNDLADILGGGGGGQGSPIEGEEEPGPESP